MMHAFLVVWMAAMSVQPEPAAPPGAEVAPTDDRIAERLPGANLEIRLPKNRWKPGKHEDAAKYVTWSRAGGYSLFVVLEDVGVGSPNDAEAARDMAGYSFATKLNSFAMLADREQSAAGMVGRRFSSDYEGPQKKLIRMELWTGMSNGTMYRVGVEGPRSGASWIATELDRVLESISRIDPERAPAGTLDVVRSPLTTEEGVTLRWPERSTMDLRPGFYGGPFEGLTTLMEGFWSSCTVHVIHFGPLRPTDEEVLAGLNQRFVFLKRTPWKRAGESGGARRWVTSVTMGVDAWKIHKRVAAFITDDSVVMVQAWTLRKDGDEEFLRTLTEETTFDRVPREPVIDTMPGGQRESAQVVHWQIAEVRATREDHAGAAAFALRALEFKREPLLVIAAAKALAASGRPREAVDLMDQGPAPTDAKTLLAWHIENARLCVKVGDRAGAIAAFGRYFETGNRDDDVLGEYLDALEAAERYDEVLRAIDTLVGGDPSAFRSRRSTALVRTGKADEAVSLLKAGAEIKPTEWPAVFEYLDLLAELDRSADLEAECRARLVDDPEATGLLVRLGRAEMSLGWFARARDTFERALKISPGHKIITEDLATATRALGQGDRKLLAENIDPVRLPEDFQTPPQAPPEAADAGVVIELDARAIRFVPGKEYRWTQTTRIRTQTRAGVDEMSTIEVSFKPAFERICINAVRVIDASGTSVDVDRSTFYVTDAGDASDTKVVVLPAAGLAVGGTVEAVYTVESVNPPPTMPYDFFWFIATEPMKRTVVWVEAPADALAWRATKAVREERRENGVAFVRDQVSALAREPASVSPIDWADHLVIGPRGAAWETVGRDYLKLISHITDAEIPAAVKEAATRADRPGGPLRERVLAISGFVQRELGYRFVAFGPRAYIPRPCAEALGDRSGDCKDHSVLLRTMLQAVGIEAHLALSSFREVPTDDIADLDAFEHMVVFVPGLDGGTFLDTTGDHTPADLAGHWKDTRALVLDPVKPRLIDVAHRSPPREGFEVSREVVVTTAGVAEVRETLTCFGRAAAFYRGMLEAASVDERRKWMASVLEYGELPVKVRELEHSDLSDLGSDLRITVRYDVPGAFRDEGGAWVGAVPAAIEFARLRAESVENRKSPFRFAAWAFDSSTIVRAEGATAEARPAFERSTPVGSASVVTSVADGAMTIRVHMEDVAKLHPPGDWAAYAAMSEALLAEVRAPVRLKRAAD